MFDTLVGQGRVPGALLFAGEEGLGKRLFAVELARALNCRARRGVEACGVCPSCKRVGRFAPPPSERHAYKKGLWSEHADVGRVLPFNRNIYVEAIRDLERECNFRPVEGAARVFLIEDAGHLNDASSNALLKTLEEATPTTHLVLIPSRPASLLPTIRSRCQVVRFAPLAVEELEGYLIKTHRRAGEEARLAAHLAPARPGVALGLNLDTSRARRAA